jgi:hypothetical protein
VLFHRAISVPLLRTVECSLQAWPRCGFQTAMQQILQSINDRLDAIDGRLDAIDGRLNAVEDSLGRLERGTSNIDRLAAMVSHPFHMYFLVLLVLLKY